MILVLGGTLEGREIASLLAKQGHKVLISVVSGYGAKMIPQEDGVEVNVGMLDEGGLEYLIKTKDIRIMVDATHPYAREITETAWETASACDVKYVRYNRPAVKENVKQAKIFMSDNYEEAAKMAFELGENVFLTIGSKNIEPFVKEGQRLSKRLVARVLPEAKVLEQCYDMGLEAKDILAMQGPFSQEMNMAIFNEYKADVLVTKDSGTVGGAETKLKAAAQLGMPVVMIARPENREIPATNSIMEVVKQVEEIISGIK
jgi:precorrin-6A/cobalt-precorrin-6A reductase